MNNQPSSWLDAINSQVSTKSGEFSVNEPAITVRWIKADIQSPELAKAKAAVCIIAADAIAPVEVQFLRSYPDAVSQEFMLRSCEPFFKAGVDQIDWSLVEQEIKASIKRFYLTDIATFGAEVIKTLSNDVYFVITAEDHMSGELVGFAMFAVTPALPYGNIKVMHVAVKPVDKASEIKKLLLSTIFKMVPQTKRLFTGLRATNKRGIDELLSWGFVHHTNIVHDAVHKIAHPDQWALLEYKADQADVLQQTALKLV